MNQTMLPITYPLITTCPMIADLLAVIGASEQALPWICNHFNQIVYMRNLSINDRYNQGTLYEHLPAENNIIFLEIPFLKSNKIKKDILQLTTNNVSEWLIACIDAGYYIRIPINLKHISLVSIRSDYIHTVLFYGYNRITREFMIADFHDGKKYDFYQYSMDEVTTAYNNSLQKHSIKDEYLEDVILYKIHDTIPKMKVNKNQIIDGLNDFLDGKDSYCKYIFSTRWEQCNFYFGCSFFDELKIDIINNNYNIKSLHALYDYSVMLQYKIKFLTKQKVISSIAESTLVNKTNRLIAQTMIGRNMGYKFLLNQNTQLLTNLFERYSQIKVDIIEIIKFLIIVLQEQ